MGASTEVPRDMVAFGRLLKESFEMSSGATGVDPAAVVSVTVDGRCRALTVEIDPNWPHVIGSTALGSAVLTAYNAASSEVTLALITQLTQAVEAGALTRAAGPAAPTEPSVERSPQELDVGFRRAREELDGARRRLAEALARRSVTGPHGLLRLGLDRGRVTGIEVVDRRRATLVPPTLLAAEALDLLHEITPPEEPAGSHRKG